LWAFNEEVLARALARSKSPRFPLSDMRLNFTIAIHRGSPGPTPSAAAELVVKAKEEFKQRIEQHQVRLETRCGLRLAQLANAFPILASNYVFRRPTEIFASTAASRRPRPPPDASDRRDSRRTPITVGDCLWGIQTAQSPGGF